MRRIHTRPAPCVFHRARTQQHTRQMGEARRRAQHRDMGIASVLCHPVTTQSRIQRTAESRLGPRSPALSPLVRRLREVPITRRGSVECLDNEEVYGGDIPRKRGQHSRTAHPPDMSLAPSLCRPATMRLHSRQTEEDRCRVQSSVPLNVRCADWTCYLDHHTTGC